MFVSINHVDKDILSKDIISSLKRKGRTFAFLNGMIYMSMTNKDLAFKFDNEDYFNDSYECESVMFMTFDSSSCKTETFKCLKDMDEAFEYSKEYLENQGDELLDYFGEETVVSWAKGEYAHGSTNFHEYVENNCADEGFIIESLSIYDESTVEDIYIDVDYQDKKINFDEVNMSLLNVVKENTCCDFLDGLKNVEVKMDKAIGFLEDKDDSSLNNKQNELVFQSMTAIFEKEKILLNMNVGNKIKPIKI